MRGFNFSHTGFKEMVKYLVDHDADVNITDKNGRSALYMALKGGNQHHSSSIKQVS